MKVFLSWSGGRSHGVAETLGRWLEQVIQAVEPWISSSIAKGTRWQAEVADKLEEAKVGIVCVTSDNLRAPWMLFEAGALSKTKGSYVCTFLLDVASAGIEPPLGQFQHTVFEKDDVRRLVETINKTIQANGERSLNEQTLAKVFEKFWPDLESQLKVILTKEEEKPVQRSERALMEEMLNILRSQERRQVRQQNANALSRHQTEPFDDMRPIMFPTYTVGTVPSASFWGQSYIHVVDDIGGPTLARSNGVNWLRISDGAIISAQADCENLAL